MPFPRMLRFAAPLLTLALVLPLAGSVPAASAAGSGSGSHPTNAAKVYRWGHASVKDEFKAPLSRSWRVNKRKLVRNQHGMLTLDSTRRSGTVSATLSGKARRYGRWEARVRGRQYGKGGTPFRAVWELTPRKRDHCGARGIVLSDYVLGSSSAKMHLRNLPKNDFTARKGLRLSRNEFHTYAVEVTRKRISWFVDTKVVRTETRPAARTGAALRHPLPPARGQGQADAPGPDADGLGALLQP